MSIADTIITNAAVLTMDPTRIRAEAVALRDDRILAVGSIGEIQEFQGADTRVIDAAGGSVLPGFIDSHLHLLVGGAELGQIILEYDATLIEATDQIRSYSAAHPDLTVVMGQGNGYSLFDGRVPRLTLDAIIADRPVALMSDDHHTVWANTAALEGAGLLHGREMPEGHEVVMGDDGLATGLLLEPDAYGPVLALAGRGRIMLGLETGRDPDPAPTCEDRDTDLGFLRRGIDYVISHGITSMVNMDGNPYTLELLQELKDAGELKARVRVPFHFVQDMDVSDLETAAEMHRRWNDDWLTTGFVKMFMDGVLESGTAFMKSDYPGRPGWRATGRFSAERFNDLATRIDAMDLQIAVHAIGDAAVGRVIDGYEAAIQANGDKDLRHRIEHIEFSDPEDLPRIVDLGLIASMQPLHAPENGADATHPSLGNLPADRWKDAFPLRKLREMGAPIALASDWTVVTVSVLEGIHGAVNALPWRDDLPKRRISLHDAIHGYTMGGAYAEHCETTKGSLSPGKLADIVILDRDIEAVAPDEIRTLRVCTTIVGGQVVYDAPA